MILKRTSPILETLSTSVVSLSILSARRTLSNKSLRFTGPSLTIMRTNTLVSLAYTATLTWLSSSMTKSHRVMDTSDVVKTSQTCSKVLVSTTIVLSSMTILTKRSRWTFPVYFFPIDFLLCSICWLLLPFS